MALSPNHDVLSDDASITYLGPDGSIRHSEPVERTDHRVFRGDAFIQHPGHSEWTNVGWARITVHQDGEKPIFEGAFRVDGDHHHIQTATNYRQTRHSDDPVMPQSDEEYMVVWRDSDVLSEGWTSGELKRSLVERASCMSDGLNFNNEDSHPIYSGFDWSDQARLHAVDSRSLFGRQIDGTTGGNGAGVNLVQTIGSTQGCFNTRKVALVGIATDCTYTGQFNSTASVRQNIIQQINAASALYESTFNISLGIQNLTISDAACPTSPSPSAPWNIGCSGGSITNRLNLFSAWRGQFNDTNAFWTLLTTCNTDSAVGLAWLGQVCAQGSQSSASGDGNETIAGANVVVRTSTEWQVIAHETGHTFGAVHDCTSSTCSDSTATLQRCCPFSAQTCDARGQFIMNPSTGDRITQFSPCSIGNVCSAIGRQAVKTNCLANNKGVNTITGSQCGNGIVEAGEDCDCGGEAGCRGNPCCNPTTCKFTENSVCDPSNEDCCTAQCQFKSNGTVCRESSGVCDPQEVCTGTSGVCPRDINAPDGTACGDPGAGLACASGQCTSRDLQCKTLMGSRTAGNDTYACSSQGCQLSCASPQFGPNMCLSMTQNFLDGTPCQGGGRCQNGVCQGASVANEIASWIADNKNIVIPIASVAGGLILIALISCCVSSFRRRARRRRLPKNMSAGSGSSWIAQYNGWGPPAGSAMPNQRGGAHAAQNLPAQPAASRSRPHFPSLGNHAPSQPNAHGVPPSLQVGPQAGPPPYSPYGHQWLPRTNTGRSMRYA